MYFSVHDNATIPLTGDEPHYMVEAQSLAQDGDLFLNNNYERQDHFAFYPFTLAPHTVPGDTLHRAAHYPALPVLLAPVFFGATFHLQIEPYTAAKITMVLLAAMIATATIRFVWRATRSPIADSTTTADRATTADRTPGTQYVGAACAFFACIAYPYLAYADQIYPELIVGGLALIPWLYMHRNQHNAAVNSGNAFGSPREIASLLAALLAIVVMPFFHVKFALLATISGVVLMLHEWQRNRRDRLWFSAMVLVLGAGSFILFNVTFYGSVFGPYAGGPGMFTQDFARRYAAYFLDGHYGILAMFPLFLWCVPGCLTLRVHSDGPWLYPAGFALAVLAAHLPNALHDNWLLGSCPVGRYWVAALPLLICATSAGVHAIFAGPVFAGAHHRRLRALALVIIGAQLFFSAGITYAFWSNQERFYLPNIPATPLPDALTWDYAGGAQLPALAFWLCMAVLPAYATVVIWRDRRNVEREFAGADKK